MLALAAPAYAADDSAQSTSSRQSDGSVALQQQEPGGGGGGGDFRAQQEPGGGGGGGGGGAEPQQEGNCHPDYEGVCLDPNSEDYDCEGGSGNGPDFVRGPFESVGSDPFELDENGEGTAEDPNGDGTACEVPGSGSGTGTGGDGGSGSGSDPKGGVDAGFGELAPRAEPTRSFLPVVSGGALMVLAGTCGLILAASRRGA